MILVTLGTQKFQFNRLLKEIDRMIETGELKEDVFAQTGGSDYIPKYFKYEKFVSPEKMDELQEQADLIITHGGTGSIIGPLKKGKKVIAIPRLAKFEEHVDDHQTEIISMFSNEDYIIGIKDVKDLRGAIRKSETFDFKPYKGSSENLIEAIIKMIEED